MITTPINGTPQMIPTLINGRWTLLLPEHRAHRPEWPWWEATRLAAMSHFIKPGDIVVDVGAEEGDFPALFAQWGADVILIEPNPLVWPNIKAIFEANDLVSKYQGGFVGFASDQNAEPTRKGLDQIAPTLTIHDASLGPHEWPACANGPLIGDHGFRHLAQETDTTPQATIDAIVSYIPVTHITMDIEGSELVALRGAVNTMRNYRPYVWVSIHPDPLKDFYCQNPEEVYSLMASLDYKRVFLTFDHESHELFVPTEKCWPL